MNSVGVFGRPAGLPLRPLANGLPTGFFGRADLTLIRPVGPPDVGVTVFACDSTPLPLGPGRLILEGMGGNVIDLLGYAESGPLPAGAVVLYEARAAREERRAPLVAVGEYVCLACREIHGGRTAQLMLGCAEAAS